MRSAFSRPIYGVIVHWRSRPSSFRKTVYQPEWEVMTRLTIALLLGAVSANVPVRAQHMNEKDSPCASVVINADLANCLSKAKDVTDAELSAVYRTIRGKLDGADAQRLVAAQRLWIQYRDA